jgi:DUF1680 family protein
MSLVVDLYAENTPNYQVSPTVHSNVKTRLELAGTVNDYTQAVINNWLLRVPHDNPAILEMFADREKMPYRDLLPWSGEFAGKYLTGLTQVLELTGDKRLHERGQAFVDQLIALQTEEGYLGPYSKEYQLTGRNAKGHGTWDLWNHYHEMMGLMLWYDRTGQQEALDTACKIGDLLCKKFLDTGIPVSSTGSTEMNQAVAHSLALLYKRTGDKRYLDLAQQVVDDFSAEGAGDYFRQGLNGTQFYQLPKPRWESLHPIMALAELYWITGNDDYKKAFENMWWSIVENDRHNNGGFSSGEQAQGNPYDPRAIETCCTIAWMAMSVEMLKMTDDSVVADELELSTLNQVIATFDPSGKWSTYNTPMDGCRVPSTVDIAFQIRPGSEELNCCSVNAARGLGMLSDWALMRSAEGLVLNWYGPSEMEATVDGTRVVLRQTTSYPREGSVAIEVSPAKELKFELKLRIPHWSKHTNVTINGEPIAAQPGRYLSLARQWKPGDTIQLELDMDFRFWQGAEQCVGKSCVYRGPLLLVFEEPRPPVLKFSKNWNAFADSRIARNVGEWVAFEFEGDTIKWHGQKTSDGGKARVLIDGKEIAVVDQYGQEHGQPLEWARSGLGAGRHELRIEILGEKSEASQGTAINYFRFETPASLPKFDAAELVDSGKISTSDSAQVFVTTRDTLGKEVILRDFGTAGQNGALYVSWLPIDGTAATDFSHENPSRTSPLAHEFQP